MEPNSPDNQNTNNTAQTLQEPSTPVTNSIAAETQNPPIAPTSPVTQSVPTASKKLNKWIILAIGFGCAIAAFLVVYFVFLAKPTLEGYCKDHKSYCEEIIEGVESSAAGTADDAKVTIEGNNIVIKAIFDSSYTKYKDTIIENLNKSGSNSDIYFKQGINQIEKDTEISGVSIRTEVYIGSEQVWSHTVDAK